MTYPHRLPTEARTRAVIDRLERDLAGDDDLSDVSRLFMHRMLAGHRRFLAEFVATREAKERIQS